MTDAPAIPAVKLIASAIAVLLTASAGMGAGLPESGGAEVFGKPSWL